MSARWIVVCGEGEDREAFGPFSSAALADDLAGRYNEAAIRPYEAIVVELWPVRELRSQLAEEEA